MFAWIFTNATALGIIAAFLTAIIPLYQFVATKREESRKHNFEAFHKMIGELVDPTTPRLDRQIAVIFELRNFKNYFPVSIRILEGLKNDWGSTLPTNSRIFPEIELTLNYMRRRNRKK